jgi:hypothetical protein
MLMFSAFVVSALVKRRDKESHKRLMLLAYISIVVAAVARLPGMLNLGPTRDRHDVDADWQGHAFRLVDTGGWVAGGTDLDDKVSRQSERAIGDAEIRL